MLAQIEIAARGDAFQFLGAERELEQNVHTGARVMREFLGLLPVFNQGRARQADAFVKFDPLLHPILVPFLPTPGGGSFQFQVFSFQFRRFRRNP